MLRILHFKLPGTFQKFQHYDLLSKLPTIYRQLCGNFALSTFPTQAKPASVKKQPWELDNLPNKLHFHMKGSIQSQKAMTTDIFWIKSHIKRLVFVCLKFPVGSLCAKVAETVFCFWYRIRHLWLLSWHICSIGTATEHMGQPLVWLEMLWKSQWGILISGLRLNGDDLETDSRNSPSNSVSCNPALRPSCKLHACSHRISGSNTIWQHTYCVFWCEHQELYNHQLSSQW